MDLQVVVDALRAKLKRRTEQNRKSVENYRERHRDKLNEKSLAYYKKKKEENPEWLKQLRERQRKYQKSRRDMLKSEKTSTVAEILDC